MFSSLARAAFEWRGIAAVAVATSAGVLVHPNFPANLELFWIQNFRILFEMSWAAKSGFDLGSEFRPFEFGDFLRFALIPSLFLALAYTWMHQKHLEAAGSGLDVRLELLAPGEGRQFPVRVTSRIGTHEFNWRDVVDSGAGERHRDEVLAVVPELSGIAVVRIPGLERAVKPLGRKR